MQAKPNPLDHCPACGWAFFSAYGWICFFFLLRAAAGRIRSEEIFSVEPVKVVNHGFWAKTPVVFFYEIR